jgi:hypothetical protein
MFNEGRGLELARIRVIVMLACPHEGSEYARSIRAVAGFGRHPQAGSLKVLDREVGEARRIVMRQVVNATKLDERNCPIPVYVYSGRTDNVVLLRSAQSIFPNAEALPGDHFSILDPGAPGNITGAVLKRHLIAAFRDLYHRIPKIDDPKLTPGEPLMQDRVTFLYGMPPDIADFTGRKEELHALSRTLSSRSASSNLRIAAISGKPGVGKS